MAADIEGFILAGGKSRRMGTDKSQLTLAGKTFIESIAEQMQSVTTRLQIVGKSAHKSFPAVDDVFANWGALGGVHAALKACQTSWALVVACDFPLVTTDLFRRLANLSGDAEAVAPIQDDGIPQPLCALYRRSACLDRAEHLINSGERKPIALLQSVSTRWVL